MVDPHRAGRPPGRGVESLPPPPPRRRPADAIVADVTANAREAIRFLKAIAQCTPADAAAARNALQGLAREAAAPPAPGAGHKAPNHEEKM